MGVYKSEQRTNIEKANLTALIEHNSLKDISLMFNTSIYIVHQVLTEQLSNRKIGFELEVKRTDTSTSSIGAWNELKETELYKQLMNK